MPRKRTPTLQRFALTDFDSPFSQLIDNTIEKAKKGDTESARTLLRWFCGAIKANTDKEGKPYRTPSGTGTHIDERILRYLGECFQQVLEGSEPDVALHLRKPPHREAESLIAKRNEDMALDMAVKIASGATYKEASLETADLWKSDKSFEKRSPLHVQDTVRKAYDTRKDDKLFKLKVECLLKLKADLRKKGWT